MIYGQNYNNIFFYSVVTVMLDAPEVVTENEGNVITACASIVESTPIEREITVVLSAINRDQQGAIVEPALMALALLTQTFFISPAVTDFVPITEQLTFDAISAASPLCRNVTIINDNIFEDDEVFQVSIESSVSGVIIPNPLINVTIIDTDSELHQCLDSLW